MATGISSTKDTTRMMVIDGDKLRNELKKRGLRQGKVSEELGCSNSYISYSITRNIIAKQSAKVLEALYNIKAEDIRPDVKQEPTKATVSEEVGQISNKELYDTIFKAVTDAFKWYANHGR